MCMVVWCVHATRLCKCEMWVKCVCLAVCMCDCVTCVESVELRYEYVGLVGKVRPKACSFTRDDAIPDEVTMSDPTE